MAKNDSFIKVVNENGTLSWLSFVSYIGAAVYFYQLDPGFWGFFLALIKAIFWPAFVVYAGMGALGIK